MRHRTFKYRLYSNTLLVCMLYLYFLRNRIPSNLLNPSITVLLSLLSEAYVQQWTIKSL